MRIIKDGTIRELECLNCDSIFEYNIDDIEQGNSTLIDTLFGCYPYNYVKCPICGEENRV